MTSLEPRLPKEDRKGYSYQGVVATWLAEDGSEGRGHATRIDVESKPQSANATPWALPHEIPAAAVSDLNQAVGAPAAQIC